MSLDWNQQQTLAIVPKISGPLSTLVSHSRKMQMYGCLTLRIIIPSSAAWRHDLGGCYSRCVGDSLLAYCEKSSLLPLTEEAVPHEVAVLIRPDPPSPLPRALSLSCKIF